MSNTIKNNLIKGTLLLTIAGLITRIIGFYNRIFLSNTIGAIEIGIYQLIFPIYLIVHAICCQGIELAVTRFTASFHAKHESEKKRQILISALLISLSLSVICSLTVYQNSSLLAEHILKEPRCANCLKIISFCFPFISVKCCILGYYYGLQKSAIPAFSNLVEQIFRVGFIYFAILSSSDLFAADASIAAAGLAFGDIFACVFCIFSIFGKLKKWKKRKNIFSVKSTAKLLLSYSLPLTFNRLFLTILQSVESILIPFMLTNAYHNRNTALNIYGTLTGMAIPFVLFPSALTNSLAMMLLPAISEAQSQKNDHLIAKTTGKCLHYCLLIGILNTAIFFAYGNLLGNTIFGNELCGRFLVTLSFICPFIYVSTTMQSILNGLGKTKLTFKHNIICIFIKIAGIIIGIPLYKIQGYLIGLLISYLVFMFLSVISLKKESNIYFRPLHSIIYPLLLSFFSVVLSYICFLVSKKLFSNIYIELFIGCSFLCLFFFAGCLLLKTEKNITSL